MDGEPGRGEVTVCVAVPGPVDAAAGTGSGRHGPGRTVAGTVTVLGPGVPACLRGRPVLTRAEDGVADRRLVVPADDVVVLPGRPGPEPAAGLADDAGTALRALALTPVRAGQDVLVLPAATGPGALLVRLLTDAGARVVGVVRGARAARSALGLGAVHAVDHGRRGWVAGVHALLPAGPAAVFDGAGGTVGRAAAWLVADGGRYTSFGTAFGPAPDFGPCEPRARRITVATTS
ncbi:hypothetical protein GCM10009613_00710 [Pseudonocardia kongjuensis]|uniref:Alcohol dehydrogenase-like C-terminal domain-containing protein n=1 Tax=Pseudonocardia kongjuensis TaxID=102227 RepID=A0ABP4I7D3_9PSEU